MEWPQALRYSECYDTARRRAAWREYGSCPVKGSFVTLKRGGPPVVVAEYDNVHDVPIDEVT